MVIFELYLDELTRVFPRAEHPALPWAWKPQPIAATFANYKKSDVFDTTSVEVRGFFPQNKGGMRLLSEDSVSLQPF